MSSVGYRLGVDLRTSNTAAVLGRPGAAGPAAVLDGFPLLPSAVCVDAGGRAVLVGRDALHAGQVHPERFDPHPKQRIDDGLVLLGERQVALADLIGAVLGRYRGYVGGRAAIRPGRPFAPVSG